jgi:hypothetical protein
MPLKLGGDEHESIKRLTKYIRSLKLITKEVSPLNSGLFVLAKSFHLQMVVKISGTAFVLTQKNDLLYTATKNDSTTFTVPPSTTVGIIASFRNKASSR